MNAPKPAPRHRTPMTLVAAPARQDPLGMRVPWVRPVFEPDDELLANLEAALTSGRLTNDGPYQREFERQLAAYLQVDDCVAVSSGSDALLLAIWTLGLPRGAKAVLPSFTFIATVNAVVHGGLTPVFCDVDPDTWTLCPNQLRRLLADDPAIRLVVPVNVFGVPPALPAIRDLADAAGATLLLDNAHGVGTEQAGVRCPLEPVAQAFSLHATKTLPAGEGGAIVARDPRLLAELRRLRNHGIAADPLASTLGCNAKMSELHAAVGLSSLRHLEGVLARRREYAARLRRVLREECGDAFAVQHIPDGVQSNFQNLGVLCQRGMPGGAVRMQAALERCGVETRRYFWPPLHQLPAYRGRWSLPVTEALGEGILCLPLHSRMDPATLAHIESALRRVGAGREA